MESEWKDCKGGSPECKKKVPAKFKVCYPCREYQQSQAKAPIKEEFVKEGNGSLKVRVIEANNGKEFERLLNEFNHQNRVIATQTHLKVMSSGTMWEALYCAVVYYE